MTRYTVIGDPYDIDGEFDLEEFEIYVNEHIELGWQLYGQTMLKSNGHMYQPMIHTDVDINGSLTRKEMDKAIEIIKEMTNLGKKHEREY